MTEGTADHPVFWQLLSHVLCVLCAVCLGGMCRQYFCSGLAMVIAVNVG